MLATIIILAIGILTAIGAYISATSKMYDPYGRGISKITPSGFGFIICAIILITLPVAQNKITDATQRKEQDIRDSKLKVKYDSSLLVMQRKLDSSNKASTILVTETLGKYGFKLDSTNKLLIDIKDSAKMRIIETESPVLTLQPSDLGNGMEMTPTGLNSYKIAFPLTSFQAGSSFFKIKSDIIIEDVFGNLHHQQLPTDKQTIPYRQQIPKDQGYKIYYNIITDIDFKMLYIWTRGEYKKIDGSTKYIINSVFFYNPQSRTSGIVRGDTEKRVVEFVKGGQK
jgi:hypothetical protein